jgi:hypothetical protein
MDSPPRIDYWRQLGIVKPRELEFPITLIGAGGIGSPTAWVLAKMGCSHISVMDDDSVEVHNFPNQLFRIEDLGKFKVEALAQIVESFTGTKIQARNERYVDQPLSGVVVVGVDNMTTRSAVWQKVKLNIGVPLLIDARMGGEIARIHVIRPCSPHDIKAYELTLYSDEEAVEVPCTERAIIYNTFMIASIIGDIIKCFAKQQDLPLEGTAKLVDMTSLSLF